MHELKRLCFLFIPTAIIFSFLLSCSDFANIGDSEITGYDAHYALPLINDRLSLSSLIGNNEENTIFRIDSTGKVTVIYEGDILGKKMEDILPPLPGLGDILITDTLITQTVNFNNGQTIDFGILSGGLIKFKFESALEEDIDIEIKIPEFRNEDGSAFTVSHLLEFTGESPAKGETEFIDLEDLDYYSDSNAITVIYDARNENGDRIYLDNIWMNWTELGFKYIEGYFPKSTYVLKGDVIPLGLYSNWVDGTMKFEDPKVTVTVENSFGMPVQAIVNDFFVHDLDWLVYPVESTILDDGIYFDYPGIDEIGTVKTTTYVFDTLNSNLNQIFSKKVRQLKYQVNALINPFDDPDLLGYMAEESYFNISASVEVPMFQTIDSLRLTDTFNIEWKDLSTFDEMTFKLILDNTFPIDLDMQIYFLDSLNNEVDALFPADGIHLPAAAEVAEGITMSSGIQEVELSFDKERMSGIKSASKIVVNPIFSSLYGPDKPVWIYDNYGLDVKMGVDFRISN